MGNSKTSKSGGSAPLKALQKFASLLLLQAEWALFKAPRLSAQRSTSRWQQTSPQEGIYITKMPLTFRIYHLTNNAYPTIIKYIIRGPRKNRVPCGLASETHCGNLSGWTPRLRQGQFIEVPTSSACGCINLQKNDTKNSKKFRAKI
jgi:hypothetical protein